MLLDIIEVARSHTGANLAAAFAEIMEDYKISEKVYINFNVYVHFIKNSPDTRDNVR